VYGRRSVNAYLRRPRHELYDLVNDPDEIHNLADDPGHAKVLADLQDRLKRWQKRTGDPWIVKYKHE
jgi:N-sulfoglucosamine sulfohydrolase